jgi:hypothetical protein
MWVREEWDDAEAETPVSEACVIDSLQSTGSSDCVISFSLLAR